MMSFCEEENTRLCPGEYDKCTNSWPIGSSPYLAIPSIVSSTASCMGCVLIVYSYYRWKELRSTGSRAIITYLSIADFFTALGYIAGSLNYSLTYNNTKPNECIAFTYICTIQSFVTTWSSISSFLWTLTLAIYLYISLVHNKMSLIRRFFPAFHVINWGFPIVICIPLLATQYLGFSFFAVSTWCYVKVEHLDVRGVSLIMIAGKFWEIMTYILVIFFYMLIKRHISSQSKKARADKSLNAGLLAVLRQSDKKLIAIPVLFVLLRCWGTLHFFYSWIVESHVHCGCTNAPLAHIFTALGIMQAIGDGGQGWVNFILYVVVSNRVYNKLFSCCVKQNNLHLQEKSSTINGNSSVRYEAVQNHDFPKVEIHEPTTA